LAPIASIPVGKRCWHFSFTPDGKEFWWLRSIQCADRIDVPSASRVDATDSTNVGIYLPEGERQPGCAASCRSPLTGSLNPAAVGWRGRVTISLSASAVVTALAGLIAAYVSRLSVDRVRPTGRTCAPGQRARAHRRGESPARRLYLGDSPAKTIVMAPAAQNPRALRTSSTARFQVYELTGSYYRERAKLWCAPATAARNAFGFSHLLRDGFCAAGP